MHIKYHYFIQIPSKCRLKNSNKFYNTNKLFFMNIEHKNSSSLQLFFINLLTKRIFCFLIYSQIFCHQISKYILLNLILYLICLSDYYLNNQ